MIPHAVPLSGYVSLWPFLDLGNDKASALYAVGCRQWRMPLAAYGYAMRIEGASKAGEDTRRLRATTLPLARLEALDKAKGRPVTLLRAVAKGTVTVWKRVEALSLMNTSIADQLEEVCEIRKDGTLIAKDYNPRVNASLTGLVNRMSKTVTHELSGMVQPLLKQAMEAWQDIMAPGVNWSDMSTEEFDQAWEVGQSFLKTAVDKGYGLAAPGIKQKIMVELTGLHEGNQKYLQNVHLPRIQTAFNQVDEQVLDSIAEQSGWWIRDSAGDVSEALTKQGRNIVHEGIKNGFGREQIAKNLINGVPGMWDKYGLNYARTVAASSVSRARSYSEVSSYTEAGISHLEIMAMLDERTTDQCRALDGTIIEVAAAMAHQIEAANVPDPRDIAKVSPFLVPRRNKDTGAKELFIHGTDTKFATINRSGQGKLDDRGSVARHMSTKALNKAGITMPPYHHNCRTMTVPRVDMVQVPEGYELNTEPSPATNDEPLPKKATEAPKDPKAPKAPKASTTPAYAPKPAHRGLVRVPMATPKSPVVTGQIAPIDTPPKRKPGAKPKATQQKPEAKSPVTLGEYNAKAKEQIAKEFGGKKVKITNVAMNSLTGHLEYDYLVDGKTHGKLHVKTNPFQRSDLEDRLKRKDKREAAKLPKPPTPGKHQVKEMQKATSARRGRGGQGGQDRRTKEWNKSTSRPETSARLAKQLEDNDDFKAMMKHAGYSNAFDFVNGHSKQWAITSKNDSRRMHYLQLAVAEEFGLPKESVGMLKPYMVDQLKNRKDYDVMMKGYRAYARAQYDETQRFLKEKGIEHIDLVRGAGVRSKKQAPGGALFDRKKREGTITTQPISSYSTDEVKAYRFAADKDLAVLTRQRVPRERIFGTFATGIGTDYETEYVVLGGKDDYAEHVTWSQGNGYMGATTALKELIGDK